MTDTLAHRGPDDRGVWHDEEVGVALGHRRLSILDLSPLGRQPMESQCGRYVICYNGEVYNYKGLQADLASSGAEFKGGSDTEVILSAISCWGLTSAVERFVGMFAFALWDRERKELSLVRDRLGIKPLYYGMAGKSFVFGSELKALRAHPEFRGDIDRGSLSLFFRHNYVPAPYSIYKGVGKLEPSCILRVADDGQRRVHRYWSAHDVWTAGQEKPFSGSRGEAAEQLESLLADAVKMRMIADVPLGAFLSGGIDSTMVVALMQAQSQRAVKTFSIGFHEEEFNEADHASAIAQHLGTEHTELYLSVSDMMDIIPSLPQYWDEPFADSSQIPTWYVSELAKRHVTVSLSGDGGDELFAGYDRYFWCSKLMPILDVPVVLRKLLVGLGKRLPGAAYEAMGDLGRKIQWRLDGLGSQDLQSLYRFLVSHQKAPSSFVLSGYEPDTALTRKETLWDDPFHCMTYWDTVSYLPDDILTKVDRASMAVGLEARVPFLDHRVVEFAASLPKSMSVSEGSGKHVLKNVLYKYVPKPLLDRPKRGFGVPVAQWLKGGMRDWSEALLDPALLKKQGYLDVAAVRTMWDRFEDGDNYYCHFLWDVLMFQAWLDGVENTHGQ